MSRLQLRPLEHRNHRPTLNSAVSASDGGCNVTHSSHDDLYLCNDQRDQESSLAVLKPRCESNRVFRKIAPFRKGGVARLRGVMRRLPTDLEAHATNFQASHQAQILKEDGVKLYSRHSNSGRWVPWHFRAPSFFDALPRSLSVWIQLRPTGEQLASSVRLVDMNQGMMNMQVLRLPSQRFSDKDGSKGFITA
jgi:hypothetical protein